MINFLKGLNTLVLVIKVRLEIHYNLKHTYTHIQNWKITNRL